MIFASCLDLTKVPRAVNGHEHFFSGVSVILIFLQVFSSSGISVSTTMSFVNMLTPPQKKSFTYEARRGGVNMTGITLTMSATRR